MFKGLKGIFGILIIVPVLISCSVDRMFYGGPILTMDGEAASRDGLAVVVRGDEIRYVGPEGRAPDVPKHRRIDLEGRLLMPGLIESHGHLFGAGLPQFGLDLRNLDTLEETLAEVSMAVSNSDSDEWIIGNGWDQTDWAGEGWPAAADLDAVSPDIPVVLSRIGGHTVWVNSRAMEEAGIDASTGDPDGGRIVRDSAGNPTGVFLDNATAVFEPFITATVGENPLKLFRAAQAEAFSNGITTFHDLAFPSRFLPLYTLFYRLGLMKINVRVYVADDENLDAYLQKKPPVSILDDRLRIAAVKAFADGAMGSHGALLSEPYDDSPEDYGIEATGEDRLREVAVLSRDTGYQLAVHAIGDAANALVVDVYEDIIGPDPSGDFRWRIEHAQFLAPDDIQRIGSLGYIPSMQPRHATSDMKWVVSRLGEERSRTTYAWRSLIDAGAIIPGGSDVPVEPLNPFWGMYAAVTRQDFEGIPPEGFHPEQKVTMQEALSMYTLWGAYAGFDEQRTGRIAPGFQADLIIIDRDITRVPVVELIDAEVEVTYLRGKEVYRRTP